MCRSSIWCHQNQIEFTDLSWSGDGVLWLVFSSSFFFNENKTNNNQIFFGFLQSFWLSLLSTETNCYYHCYIVGADNAAGGTFFPLITKPCGKRARILSDEELVCCKLVFFSYLDLSTYKTLTKWTTTTAKKRCIFI